MTVVDTSVWVAFLRGRDELLRRRLENLLDSDLACLTTISRIELAGGAPRKLVGRLSLLFRALPTFVPTQETWDRAEAWAEAGAHRGEHFGAADLLIAALAAEHDCAVWSLDADFARMKKLGWIMAE